MEKTRERAENARYILPAGTLLDGRYIDDLVFALLPVVHVHDGVVERRVDLLFVS